MLGWVHPAEHLPCPTRSPAARHRHGRVARRGRSQPARKGSGLRPSARRTASRRRSCSPVTTPAFFPPWPRVYALFAGRPLDAVVDETAHHVDHLPVAAALRTPAPIRRPSGHRQQIPHRRPLRIGVSAPPSMPHRASTRPISTSRRPTKRESAAPVPPINQATGTDTSRTVLTDALGLLPAGLVTPAAVP